MCLGSSASALTPRKPQRLEAWWALTDLGYSRLTGVCRSLSAQLCALSTLYPSHVPTSRRAPERPQLVFVRHSLRPDVTNASLWTQVNRGGGMGNTSARKFPANEDSRDCTEGVVSLRRRCPHTLLLPYTAPTPPTPPPTHTRRTDRSSYYLLSRRSHNRPITQTLPLNCSVVASAARHSDVQRERRDSGLLQCLRHPTSIPV